MPYPSDKVTMMDDTSGGTPYKNLKQEDLRRNDDSRPVSINSVVEVTISGRTVYRPKPK